MKTRKEIVEKINGCETARMCRNYDSYTKHELEVWIDALRWVLGG